MGKVMENSGSTEYILNGSIKKSDIEVEKFDLEEVTRHASADDCWVVYGKNVYDVTKFLELHPGGADIILREAGNNISAIFQDTYIHAHSISAYNLLQDYKIGEIKDTEGLEEIDQLDYNSNELMGWREDLVDWNRGMVFQVHKFGHDYIKWVHSPVNKTLKMFDNEFVEFFSNTRWQAIPIVWLPVVIISAVFAYLEFADKLQISPNYLLNQGGALLLISLLFTSGFFLWTIIEYLLHRYVFHMEPNGNSSVQITLHFFFHGLHHKVPFDNGRLVFPPPVAGVIAIIIWYLLNTCFPLAVSAGMFSGILAGYTSYDLIHYYIHHGSPSEGSFLQNMKSYHNIHHFGDHESGFGISSKFWDYVFNTVVFDKAKGKDT